MLFDEVTIQNYGCVRDLKLQLSPIHAFIGPNDSGKSTILRAVRTALQFAAGSFERGADGKYAPFDPGVSAEDSGEIALRQQSAAYRIAFHAGTWTEIPEFKGHRLESKDRAKYSSGIAVLQQNHIPVRLVRGSLPSTGEYPQIAEGQVGLFNQKISSMLLANGSGELLKGFEELRPFFTGLRAGPRFLRPDPDALRSPSELLTNGAASLEDDRGAGLARVLDAVRDRDDGSFEKLRADLIRLFPMVKSLQLRVVDRGKKEVNVELTNGKRIPAQLMSEGMLYYLAFAVLPYLSPAAALLIEEPENGLHPARIQEVMKVLREISKTTQVLLATHSPLVVNELRGEEVSVITRTPEAGTQAVLMKDTKDFTARSAASSLGELWLHHADGVAEQALREGGPRPSAPTSA